MPRKAYLPLLSQFIRDYLIENGEASPYDILKAIRSLAKEEKMRGVSYQSIRNCFWWLKKLGLIEPSGRTEPSEKPYLQPKVYYRLTEKGKRLPPESIAWRDPRRVLYPETAH
jgi:DNA-binding PadR family transcriptional regulator